MLGLVSPTHGSQDPWTVLPTAASPGEPPSPPRLPGLSAAPALGDSAPCPAWPRDGEHSIHRMRLQIPPEPRARLPEDQEPWELDRDPNPSASQGPARRLHPPQWGLSSYKSLSLPGTERAPRSKAPRAFHSGQCYTHTHGFLLCLLLHK